MAVNSISKDLFDAVLFDMDGVVTRTADIHAACWKKMFDEFLQEEAQRTGRPFVPFDIAVDYNLYVDGMLRQEGVRSFLESRGIQLAPGNPNAPVDQASIWGLGNRKERMFMEMLQDKGVEVFADGIALLVGVRQLGLKTAVVSSSKNCRAVLQAARIEEYFDVRVDGVTVEQCGLSGKPAPDAFLHAAKLLGVSVERAVVVEDAISGIQAGRRGNFGLVVGVARKGDKEKLKQNGADMVVLDLRTLMQ